MDEVRGRGNEEVNLLSGSLRRGVWPVGESQRRMMYGRGQEHIGYTYSITAAAIGDSAIRLRPSSISTNVAMAKTSKAIHRTTLTIWKMRYVTTERARLAKRTISVTSRTNGMAQITSASTRWLWVVRRVGSQYRVHPTVVGGKGEGGGRVVSGCSGGSLGEIRNTPRDWKD